MMRKISATSAIAAVGLAMGLGVGHAQTQFGASDDPTYCDVWGALSTDATDRCPEKGPSRGLSIGGTTQGPSTTGSAAAAAEPTPEAPRSASFGSIQFELNSARLTPRAMVTLDTVGEVLADPGMAGRSFVVEGHTDASGSDDYNRRLSAERARAVVDYLVSHYDLPEDRFSAVGRGEVQLLPGLAPVSAEHRRVVIMNAGT
ncbi:MAG TPA: OmpA family protein [Alphaproteobacteria bacterium]|nr:OmpA family protein [Alphaproteobacteria bacterium]